MCGIAALLLAQRDAPLVPDVARPLIEPMTRALAHRGPDGEGFWYGPSAAFGHRRLAILDLVTGDQPMASPDAGVQVVFNGEIYNHHELRAELEERGHEFRTRSDTEVLVHGFRAWGRDLPRRLLGMFAFCAHDAATGETLIARDHLGKKPLFFASHEGFLLLASEVRSFLAVEGFRPSIDPGALRELLALRYVPGARTLLAGVEELEPGHLAWHRPGRPLEAERYWQPSFEARPRPAEAAAAELRELLSTCVGARLEADVPLGAFLSGGVDSSGVVAAMVKTGHQRSLAVTVGFEEAACDERPFARDLAHRLGIDLAEEVCRPDPLEDLAALRGILDLPQTDCSAWPTWLLSRAARRHVKVALSGDGGDESFAGYRRYRFDLLENRIRGFLPRRPAHFLAAVAPKGDWLPRPLRWRRTLENLAHDPAEAYFRSVSALLPEEVDELLLPEVAGDVDPFRQLRQVYEASRAPDHGSRLLDLDLRTYLPGDILTKVDRCSMAVSLEVRAPFLDRRMIDWAASLPLELKIDRSGGKKILKQALEPWLGAKWMRRPKQGFVVPLAGWLRGPLRDARQTAMGGAFARRFCDPRTLERYAREHDAGVRDRSEALWAILVLHIWNGEWGKQA